LLVFEKKDATRLILFDSITSTKTQFQQNFKTSLYEAQNFAPLRQPRAAAAARSKLSASNQADGIRDFNAFGKLA
jgi:hypothetical protein